MARNLLMVLWMFALGVALGALLSACGYEPGDMDRQLDCSDGCTKSSETSPADPQIVEVPAPVVTCAVTDSETSVTVSCSNGLVVDVEKEIEEVLVPVPATCTVIKKIVYKRRRH